VKAGYREGEESGNEAHLQRGFNHGFVFGASVAREWGKLRGAVSALMSLVISKSLQDTNANIMAEITELFTQVTQMETSSLDTQTMQQTLENRMTVKNELTSYQRSSKRNNIREEKVDGDKLASAFRMLHTEDTTNRHTEVEVNCETNKEKMETNGATGFPNTGTQVMSEECNVSLGTPKIVNEDLELLWSRTFELAENIGIGRQKLLLVKNT